VALGAGTEATVSEERTEEPIDPYAAERALVFAVNIDEFALLATGEPDERVAVLLEIAREGLEGELTVVVVDLFVQAILRRKTQIEWNAMPEKAQ
jgi:hypothetical protein